MKKFLIASLIVLVAPIAMAQLCTEIPITSERDLRLATYSVAQSMEAAYQAALPTPTLQQYWNAKLGKLITTNPGEVWRLIAEMRQSTVANCSVNWGSLTYDQLVTQIENVWPTISRMRYEDISAPE